MWVPFHFNNESRGLVDASRARRFIKGSFCNSLMPENDKGVGRSDAER